MNRTTEMLTRMNGFCDKHMEAGNLEQQSIDQEVIAFIQINDPEEYQVWWSYYQIRGGLYE